MVVLLWLRRQRLLGVPSANERVHVVGRGVLDVGAEELGIKVGGHQLSERLVEVRGAWSHQALDGTLKVRRHRRWRRNGGEVVLAMRRLRRLRLWWWRGIGRTLCVWQCLMRMRLRLRLLMLVRRMRRLVVVGRRTGSGTRAIQGRAIGDGSGSGGGGGGGRRWRRRC